MKIENVSKIKGNRQDGAISNGYLFSFDTRGICTVYEIKSLGCIKDGEAEIFAEFVLDKNDVIIKMNFRCSIRIYTIIMPLPMKN